MACLTMNLYTLKTYVYFKARVSHFFFTACAHSIYLVFLNYSRGRGMAKLLFKLRINSHHLAFMVGSVQG